MKKLMLIAVLMIFCTTVFWGSTDTVESIIRTLDKNIVKIKEHLKGVEGKKGEDAAGILKVCDQLLANNYSLLTKLEYKISKEKSRMSGSRAKKMKNLLRNYSYDMKSLKRSVETGDLNTEVVKTEKAVDVSIKAELEAEKLVSKTITDAQISHKIEVEITIGSNMAPGIAIVNYGKNIDIKIRNASQIMLNAKKILDETGEHPRIAVRKEKGQVNALVRDSEATLKQMNYLLEKNAFRLKGQNIYKKRKNLIRDYVFKIRKFKSSVNDFFNPPRHGRKSSGTSITSRLRNMFSGSGKKREHIPEYTYKSRFQEALPSDEERSNDRVYIVNNFDRIEKRFVFIENSLVKLKTIDRASKESMEYQDEISYLFRQSGRALKNIEMKLDQNKIVFEHDRTFKKYEKIMKKLYAELTELMHKHSEFKKNM